MLNWLLLRTLHTVSIFAGIDSAYVVKVLTRQGHSETDWMELVLLITPDYWEFRFTPCNQRFRNAGICLYGMVRCMLLEFLQCENGANSLYVQPAVPNWASHKFLYTGRQFKFIYAGRQLFLCPVTTCSFTPGRSSIYDLRQFFFGQILTK